METGQKTRGTFALRPRRSLAILGLVYLKPARTLGRRMLRGLGVFWAGPGSLAGLALILAARAVARPSLRRHRGTLEAIFAGARTVQAGPNFGDLPTLWVHGELDVLAPLDATTEAMKHLRGSNIEEHVYPGAQHEVLNEINKDEVLDDVVRFLRRELD